MSRKSPTLLCTSHGLVMADRSQPVIIMALERREQGDGMGMGEKKSNQMTHEACDREKPYMTISFLVGLLDTKDADSFSSVIGSVAFTMFWNMVLFLRGVGKGSL